jgi:cytochrome c peroxidase
MDATSYYPDLFAWAFGSPRSASRESSRRSPSSSRAMVSSSSRWDTGYAQVFSPEAPDRALDVDLPNFTPQENRGRQLFMTAVAQGGAGCSSCHLPPTFALAADSRSNGLDAGETRLFKAPSLRSVGLTGLTCTTAGSRRWRRWSSSTITASRTARRSIRACGTRTGRSA